MEVMTFTYTKDNGKISSRTFIPITKPSELYFGVDISEISPIAQGEFISKLTRIHNQYMAALEGVRAEFDLTHSLRSFKPSCISNLEKESV